MDPKYQEIVENVKEFLLDEKKRAYTIVASAAIFSAFYIFFLIVPGVKTFGVLTLTSVERNKKVVSAKADIAKFDATEEKLNVLKSEFSTYADQIPGKKEIAVFLDSLAAIAKNSGVQIVSVTPRGGQSASPKTGKVYSNIMVVISAKGGFHGIRSFVGELESGNGFPSIRDIRLQYDPKSPTRHDANIVLKIYVSPKGKSDKKTK